MKRAFSIARLLFLIFAATAAHAQETVIQTEENSPGTTANSPDQRRAPPIASAVSQAHKFWDSEIALLFTGVAGARGLDYSSTLNIRRRGLDEALLTNAIVDNHPAFAGIEVSGIAASIGVSYLFHHRPSPL